MKNLDSIEILLSEARDLLYVDLNKSKQLFQQVIKIKPNISQAYDGLAQAAELEDETILAIKYYGSIEI